MYKNILITGGCGFIGANFIHFLYSQNYNGNIINVDKLTYASNLANLHTLKDKTNYYFYKQDICNYEDIESIFIKHNIDCIIHFAAESHVDRSIYGPKDFILTNILGTFNLLEICRKQWKSYNNVRFHHISTDEVYGSLDSEGYFYENTPYAPRSPYSASKASSDHLVSAYFNTYGLPITISNCSNNYGLYQHSEKLIPQIILNIKNKKPLPVYGDGRNIRDWIWVGDHCSAIYKILQSSKIGESYNIGGENEMENIELVKKICKLMDEALPGNKKHENLITFVEDRPGHDRRYAVNCDKIKKELNWRPEVDFDLGLRKTIEWYISI